MKKPQFSIRSTLLVIISVLNILIAVLVGSDVYSSWVKLDETHALTEGSVTINLLYRTEKYLSLERGSSLPLIYASPDTAKSLNEDIAGDRKAEDATLQQALARIGSRKQTADVAALMKQVSEKLKALEDMRQALDLTMGEPPDKRDFLLPDKMFSAETDLIETIRNLILAVRSSLQTIDATVNQQMVFKYSVWEITEYAGREYALIGKVIAQRKPISRDEQENLKTWRALVQHGWDNVSQSVAGSGIDSQMKPYIDEAQTHYFMTFDQIKDIFYTPEALAPTATYPLNTDMWLVLASQAVDSLLALKDESLQETQKYVYRMEHRARQEIITSVFLFLCSLAISLYCLMIIIVRVIRPVNAMVDALYKTALGQPHDPLPTLHRHDEIGKLASVLELLEENARQIKQSNEELERYAYITAHDLKSPLRAIDNLSQWIEEDLGTSITGETKKHMDTLRQRVRRMEKLLGDTLEYSRIGRQAQPANNEVMNGKALVEDAVSLAAPPPGFAVKISDRFSDIKLNRLPVQQAFYNLINNAIKHHDKKTGTIEISVEQDPAYYIFSVRDDGPGIPRQYHERIFEMFQTLKPRDEREGSGMGLAIVRKILTTCGGTITVESEPGKGALFRFTWPKAGKERKDAWQRNA